MVDEKGRSYQEVESNFYLENKNTIYLYFNLAFFGDQICSTAKT